MRQLAQQPYRWVFPAAAILLYAAVFLRAVIIYRGNSYFIWMLIILLIWLILAVSESAVSRRLHRYFPFYLALQTILVLILLNMPDPPDLFATLLYILSMQVMLRLSLKVAFLWVVLCVLAMGPILARTTGMQAVASTLISTAGIVFLGFYALTTRRAQEARLQNQKLAQQLQEANTRLTAYSAQLEKLGAARERAHLARDLHDSVTQTVFSMSLTAQSAGLLFDKNPYQVKAQLQRLDLLTQSALSEMKLLVSETHPSEAREGGLTATLRSYIQSHVFPRYFSISFQSEGQGVLGQIEEQGLFRIVQEALNNVIKHSQASRASLNLHLVDPFWIEVADLGQGFDITQAMAGNSIGLKSMYERAAEIGWTLNVVSSPGSGTKVRIEKMPSAGR
jgi:signal transduction histidine kinase